MGRELFEIAETGGKQPGALRRWRYRSDPHTLQQVGRRVAEQFRATTCRSPPYSFAHAGPCATDPHRPAWTTVGARDDGVTP